MRSLLEGGGGVTETESGRVPSAAENEAADFVKVVLGSTEDVWTEVLPSAGRRYEPPKLVLFTEARPVGLRNQRRRGRAVLLPARFPGLPATSASSASSTAASARPATSRRRTWWRTRSATTSRTCSGSPSACTTSATPAAAREESTSCRVGDRAAGRTAWPASGRSTPTAARQLIEPGDAEEGLRAASAIGDDRLQQQARGRVAPESFTHGSSAQRVRWFKTGMASGRVADCDTFGAAGP